MNIFITEDDMCTTQKLNLARVHKWFEANNCKIIDDANIADKILVMTCNGFSLLEDRSYKRIQEYKENYKNKMIAVGCLVDSHPKQVAEIWDGPVVKTESKKTMSFSDIENLFPDFNTPLCTPWLSAKNTSTLQELLKLFKVSNDLSDGLGM